MRRRSEIILISFIVVFSIDIGLFLYGYYFLDGDVYFMFDALQEPEQKIQDKQKQYEQPNKEHYIEPDDTPKGTITEKLMEKNSDIRFFFQSGHLESFEVNEENQTFEIKVVGKEGRASIFVMYDPLQELQKQFPSKNIVSFAIFLDGYQVPYGDNDNRIRVEFGHDSKLIEVVGFSKL